MFGLIWMILYYGLWGTIDYMLDVTSIIDDITMNILNIQVKEYVVWFRYGGYIIFSFSLVSLTFVIAAYLVKLF